MKQKDNQQTIILQQEINRQMMKQRNKAKYVKATNYSQQTTVTTSGSCLLLLNNMARGDSGLDNFHGDFVRPVKLSVRAIFSTNQTFTTWRFIVFQWLDSTTPIPSGILQTTGSTLGCVSPYLWTNIKKIRVLRDDLFTMFPVNGSYASKVLEYELSSCFSVVQYATGSTAIQGGAIYALVISDDSVVTYPYMELYTQLTFSDSTSV
jgi:hypothetical protein